MNILFIILKIIGILLLTIFIIAVLLLFHPVYYCMKGEAEENICAEGYVWWLFQIVRLEFRVKDSRARVRLRIFGFPKDLQKDTAEEDSAENIRSENTLESTDAAMAESDKHTKKAAAQKEHPKKEKSKSGDKDNGRKPYRNKLSDFKAVIRSLKKEASDKRNKLAVSKLWQELLYLLFHLKPKYIKADISFSSGDPALTGQVTGALSLLPILYRYDAHIYPDFKAEEFYIRGNLALKGHMALFHFIRSGIHILRDKNIRRLWHKFRK